MTRVLDLNSVQTSIMDLTLQDEKKTVVHLDFPSEALVTELKMMQDELESLKTGDRQAIEQIFELAAKLINCNLDLITVTAQELRSVYRMTVVSALKFFSAYLDFIKAIEHEKN